jgi:hypothetical protein
VALDDVTGSPEALPEGYQSGCYSGFVELVFGYCGSRELGG